MGLMKIITAMAGLGILLRNLQKWPSLGLDFSSERRVQLIFLITRKGKIQLKLTFWTNKYVYVLNIHEEVSEPY